MLIILASVVVFSGSSILNSLINRACYLSLICKNAYKIVAKCQLAYVLLVLNHMEPADLSSDLLSLSFLSCRADPRDLVEVLVREI